jgi:iron(III) transport system substrate-binding protein
VNHGRRRALALLAAGITGGLAACTRRTPTPNGTVVLYSSVDDEYLRLVVEKFEKSTGIRVLVKGDTEATKTTGLVERLRAEFAAGKPGADVWWSSEPFLTIALADEGVLTPMADEVFGDLPKEHWGEGNLWGCFAQRARVVVHASPRFRVPSISVDRTNSDVLSKWYPRQGLAIARAAFGTTRGHFGAILATIGEDRFVAWLRSLRVGKIKIVDGNSAVVRAVAAGEMQLGLTDSDDVWAGIREGWKVDCDGALIGRGDCAIETEQEFIVISSESEHSWGPMMIPNTVGLVKHGLKPELGAQLARFLMSAEVERMLMESDSHNMPVRPALMDEMRNGPLKKFVLEPIRSQRTIEGVMMNGVVQPTLRAIVAAAPRAVELARAEGLA